MTDKTIDPPVASFASPAPPKDDRGLAAPGRYSLTLMGEEWQVHVTAMDDGNLGEINHDILTITIDRTANFYHTLHHEIMEYLLEEMGCHYGNYDGDHKFIMTHTQMDVIVKLMVAAVDSLTLCDHDNDEDE